MTEAKIRSARKLLSQGTPPKEVAASLGVSVPTLYRWSRPRALKQLQSRSSVFGADDC